MRVRWYIILLVTAILLSAAHGQPVQAARGVPGSAEFGYGAHINLDGQQIEQALQLSGSLRLDWLTIDLAWAALMPDPTVAVDFTRLDQVMKAASQNQTAVMISITQPPAWALTDQGPNPNLAAILTQMLASRYPGTLQAVELFPAANTLAGWGAAPNPAAYWSVYSTVRAKLTENNLPIQLIAGGLEILPQAASNAINELDFLRGLFQAGATNIPVVSLRFTEISGQPSDATVAGETRILRRYEAVRQVMLDNNQGNSLLWVTRLAVPDGTINPAEISLKEPAQQSNWLSQAAAQLRAQLSIGMVVFADLNAVNPSQPASKGVNLLSGGGHPFAKVLRDIIQHNDPGDMTSPPGRAKSDAFTKLRP